LKRERERENKKKEIKRPGRGAMKSAKKKRHIFFTAMFLIKRIPIDPVRCITFIKMLSTAIPNLFQERFMYA